MRKIQTILYTFEIYLKKEKSFGYSSFNIIINNSANCAKYNYDNYNYNFMFIIIIIISYPRKANLTTLITLREISFGSWFGTCGINTAKAGQGAVLNIDIIHTHTKIAK